MAAEIVSQIVDRYNTLVEQLHVEDIIDIHETFVFGQLEALQYVLFLMGVEYSKDDDDYIWVG